MNGHSLMIDNRINSLEDGGVESYPDPSARRQLSDVARWKTVPLRRLAGLQILVEKHSTGFESDYFEVSLEELLS